MGNEDIKTVVAETLAEQQRLHHDEIDAVVLKTIATILISFGIEEEDRKELRADFRICGAGARASSRRRAIHSRPSLP